MKVANAPVSWGVSEATGGAQPSPERFLTEVASCGYKGIELGPIGYLERHPAALRRSLERCELALVGAFCPVTLHDRSRRAEALATADELIALLAAAGAGMLVLADAGDAHREAVAGRVPADRSSGLTDDQWDVFAEGANEVAERAQAQGLATSFHPHAATYVETPAEIDALLVRADPTLLGLCLDTGHVVYGGGDPVELARRHAGRISHVHLKDVRRPVLDRIRAAGGSFADAVAAGVFAPLGAGDVDFAGTIGALGPFYGGWLVVEQDRVVTAGDTSGAARSDAEQSIQYLDTLSRVGRSEPTPTTE